MESPGEYLRREREQRGISLASIFEATRVPRNCLEALERDDYETLPHPTFVKGYIKSYCRHLGLDETDAVLRYELYLRESSERPQRNEHSLSIVKAETSSSLSGNSRNIYILIGVGLLMIVLFYMVSPGGGGRATAPEPVAAASDDATAGRDAAAKAEAVPETEKKAAQPARPGPVAAEEAVRKTARPGHRLTARATEEVWIQVSVDGDEPVDVLLKEGEAAAWEAEDGFSLVVGNAGGVSLTLDGEDLGPLGKSGHVAHLDLGGKAVAGPGMPVTGRDVETGTTIKP